MNLQVLSPTRCAFSLTDPATINHLVIFLLPETTLPPEVGGVTVHLLPPGKDPNEPGSWIFLGLCVSSPDR